MVLSLSLHHLCGVSQPKTTASNLMCINIYFFPPTEPFPLSLFLFFFWSLFSFSNQSLWASSMVDLQTVCCLCGDVGFPDKLFRCTRCCHRFQHSYCSNYYSESSEKIELCDWCQSEERSTKHSGVVLSSRRSGVHDGVGSTNRSEYSGEEKVKQHKDKEEHTDKGKSTGSAPSPRPTARRYKLLKDVMC